MEKSDYRSVMLGLQVVKRLINVSCVFGMRESLLESGCRIGKVLVIGTGKVKEYLCKRTGIEGFA